MRAKNLIESLRKIFKPLDGLFTKRYALIVSHFFFYLQTSIDHKKYFMLFFFSVFFWRRVTGINMTDFSRHHYRETARKKLLDKHLIFSNALQPFYYPNNDAVHVGLNECNTFPWIIFMRGTLKNGAIFCCLLVGWVFFTFCFLLTFKTLFHLFTKEFRWKIPNQIYLLINYFHF